MLNLSFPPEPVVINLFKLASEKHECRCCDVLLKFRVGSAIRCLYNTSLECQRCLIDHPRGCLHPWEGSSGATTYIYRCIFSGEYTILECT